MKRLFIFLFLCSVGFAQTTPVAVLSGRVTDGNGSPVAYATIRVCQVSSTGTPCTPTVPIYSSYTLSSGSQLPNPTTADANGFYTLYVPQLSSPNLYVVQQQTLSGTWQVVGNGASAASALSVPVAISQGGTGTTSAAAAIANLLGNPAAGSYAVTCVSGTSCAPGYAPVNKAGDTMSGTLTMEAGTEINSSLLNSSVNVVQTCSGSDIGAQINSCLSTYSNSGNFFIPKGTYSFSTPISITQSGAQQLSIRCDSRATQLDYTGSGAAITITGGNLAAQVTIENCTLDGTSAASGTDGVFVHDAQNVRLVNSVVSNFPGISAHFLGATDNLIIGSDLRGGGVNIKLENDAVNNLASTANHMYGGSLQYGVTTNFWDAGESTSNSGNSDNTLDGVTMEENPPVPNFIIEGTWNDAIVNSYVECLYQTNTANYYSGIIGNKVGSGYGSQTSQSADQFTLSNNFFGTCQPGSGDQSAALDIINSYGLNVSQMRDAGYLTYGYYFDPAGSNQKAVIGPSNMGWGTALYANAPADGQLYQDAAQPLAVGEYSYTSGKGLTLGGGLSATDAPWNAPLNSSVDATLFPQNADGITPTADFHFGNLDTVFGYITGDGTNHGVIQQYATSFTGHFTLFINPFGGDITIGNSSAALTLQPPTSVVGLLTANAGMNVAAGDVTLHGKLQIGSVGTPISKLLIFALTESPAAVAANTCSLYTFAAANMASTDLIMQIVKGTGQPGLTITPGAAGANTWSAYFCNSSAASITPTAGDTYTVYVVSTQ